MKDKLSFKNPDDLKPKIERLICFQENENPLEPPRKVKDKNPDNLGLLSKYRKVLSCSLVNPVRTTASVERIGAEKT